jgi:sugar/nucleoside kinase (ribokinase family)
MKLARVGGVLCCGNVVFDIPVWPVEELKWHTSTWVESVIETIGGNGANTSYTLGMLGAPVRLISVVGADTRGDRLIGILEQAGVDTSAVVRSTKSTTPVSVAVVNSKGDRAFLHRPGASRDIEPASVTFDHGAGYTHFHLANPFALPKLRMDALDVMRRAKEAGMTTSLDTGWDSLGRWIEDLGPALPFTDLLFVNDAEARMLGQSEDLDEAAASLRSRGAHDIVVKLGPDGCGVYECGGYLHVPGCQVNPVDTTGAGDCFAGAFLAGLYRGCETAECARLANAVGAMVVERLGATTGVAGFDETLAWMDAHKNA